jgi:hypothetical protein
MTLCLISFQPNALFVMLREANDQIVSLKTDLQDQKGKADKLGQQLEECKKHREGVAESSTSDKNTMLDRLRKDVGNLLGQTRSERDDQNQVNGQQRGQFNRRISLLNGLQIFMAQTRFLSPQAITALWRDYEKYINELEGRLANRDNRPCNCQQSNVDALRHGIERIENGINRAVDIYSTTHAVREEVLQILQHIVQLMNDQGQNIGDAIEKALMDGLKGCQSHKDEVARLKHQIERLKNPVVDREKQVNSQDCYATLVDLLTIAEEHDVQTDVVIIERFMDQIQEDFGK